jgi:hypothetical protein
MEYTQNGPGPIRMPNRRTFPNPNPIPDRQLPQPQPGNS